MIKNFKIDKKDENSLCRVGHKTFETN